MLCRQACLHLPLLICLRILDTVSSLGLTTASIPKELIKGLYLFSASKAAVHGHLAIFKDSGGDNAGVNSHQLKFVTQSGSIAEIQATSEGAGGPNGRGGYLSLFSKPNIIHHGFLNLKSISARKIIESCHFLISPSCSEGQSTSVLAGMTCGLIPILTEECGINIDENIYLLKY